MSFLSKIGKMIGSSPSSTNAPKSASKAKERLSVILASQRNSSLLEGVNMDALQKDVLAVVRRHIQGVAQVQDETGIKCGVKNEGNVAFFEMSVEIDAAGNSHHAHHSTPVSMPNTNTANRGHRTAGVKLNTR